VLSVGILTYIYIYSCSSNTYPILLLLEAWISQVYVLGYIPPDLGCCHLHLSLQAKIDNLPVLATCWSGTLAILSSKVNGLVLHGSTRYCSWKPLTNLTQSFRACYLCTFKVVAIFFGTIPTYGILPYTMIRYAWVSCYSVTFNLHVPVILTRFSRCPFGLLWHHLDVVI